MTSKAASTRTITFGPTVATEIVNTNDDNSSTSAYLQRFANTIELTINA
ncbi:hypothetical protein G5V57_23045 [Nordella sp. HKS 07]|nr:hypothetical protein [Nordella sp. HKS 07]QIG50349.1 hypothetical protein G5V57_23045 [Nordella sp. HKS 07]